MKYKRARLPQLASGLFRSAWVLILCAGLSVLPTGFAVGDESTARSSDRKHIVVATYEYPGRNRAEAVAPLAELVTDITGLPSRIRVAATPTELAEWIVSGEAQVAVPNLVAYLAMRTVSDSITGLVVPAADVENADDDEAYTSSIVVPVDSPAVALSDLEKSDAPRTLVMVWPDSASGALVAGARLRHELNGRFAEFTIRYAGSHQNVLTETAAAEDRVGIVASKVYRDYLASAESPGLRELWRSEPIPFGPLVCRESPMLPCDALRERLLQSSLESADILSSLKTGWPEFAGTSSFERPVSSRYQPLIEAYALRERASDKSTR